VNLYAELLELYQQTYDDLLKSETPPEITIDHVDLFKTISLLGSLPL